MNFFFNASSRMNTIFYQSFLARAGNWVRDVRAFPFIAGIAIICTLTFSRDCYPLMLTAAFCARPVTVYRFLFAVKG